MPGTVWITEIGSLSEKAFIMLRHDFKGCKVNIIKSDNFRKYL
jgi:hypothetical protein